MSKKIKAYVKLQLPAGAATPAPPVGSSLGPHGLNTMDFCKRFNAETASRKGETVPVVVTVYVDKTFSFITKTAPTSELLKKFANMVIFGLEKLSQNNQLILNQPPSPHPKLVDIWQFLVAVLYHNLLMSKNIILRLRRESKKV
jgi:hypothetical protein